jgi:hypothetical protein
MAGSARLLVSLLGTQMIGKTILISTFRRGLLDTIRQYLDHFL